MDSVQNRAETEHPRAEQHEKNNNNNNNNNKKLNYESSTSSPPSATSSPSHEFSFTISLHSSYPNSSLNGGPCPEAVLDRNTAAKTPNNSFAIDLSPADDIFFHGHLLPLHLLSHLTPPLASPRSSTNSLNGFTLPIKDLILDEQKNPNHEQENRPGPRPTASSKSDSKIACKSKSFSLFGMPRWRKVVSEVRRRKDISPNPNTNTNTSNTKKKQSKKNLVLEDVSQLLKRYIRIVRPLLFLKRNNRELDEDRDDNIDLEHDFSGQQQSSFSGNLSTRRTNKNEFHVRSGTSELFSSAPASTRTSPTNSGPLVPTPTVALRTSNSSTMEELQAAIQAAIAHCKNSNAAAQEGKAVKA